VCAEDDKLSVNVMAAQLLYQDTLKGALEGAKRGRQVGMGTYVLADARGSLANMEVTMTQGLVVEEHQGHLARWMYGSAKMTGGEHNERTKEMYGILREARGRLNRARLQEILAGSVFNNAASETSVFFMGSFQLFHLGPPGPSNWKSAKLA
jgi:hypothetical protein